MEIKKEEHNQNSKRELSASIVVITLIFIITYLPLINQLGFYRDDWYLIWSGHTHGFQKIVEIFTTDRPVVGYIYAWTYSLFGDIPLNWNIFSAVLRYISFLSMFWILNIIWRGRIFSNTLITILFAVYPGFLQQPNANTFSNLFITFALALISIAITLQAVTVDKRWVKLLLLTISAILTGAYLILGEYLIGMEAVRFVLVWYYLGKLNYSKTNKQKTILTALYSIPNIIASVLVMIWRIFLFESTRPAMNVDNLLGKYAESPIYIILRFVIEFLKDILELILGAWVVPFYNLAEVTRLKELAISFVFFIVAAGLVLIYIYWISKKEKWQGDYKEINEQDENYSFELILLGLICVIVTALPVIISNRNVIFKSNWDRYSLQSTFGVALLIFGLLSSIPKRSLRYTLYAILVGVSVATHFNNAVYFKNLWESQKQYWWQLSWRAPQILPETVLVGFTDNYRFEEDYEIWAPANLIYYPQSQNLKILTEVLDISTTHKIISQFWDRGSTRTIEYDRDYSNTLLAYIPSPFSCLHIIDGNKPLVSEYAEPLSLSIAPFSKIDRISTIGASVVPPVEIFGKEIEHTWCYYFQRASLAQQNGNWKEVARLGDEAQEHGLKPADWSEWVPFLMGYANNGELKKAKRLIPIIKEQPFVRFQLCEILKRGLEKNKQEASDFVFDDLCLRK